MDMGVQMHEGMEGHGCVIARGCGRIWDVQLHVGVEGHRSVQLHEGVDGHGDV